MVICNYKAELMANDFSITHCYTPDRKKQAVSISTQPVFIPISIVSGTIHLHPLVLHKAGGYTFVSFLNSGSHRIYPGGDSRQININSVLT